MLPGLCLAAEAGQDDAQKLFQESLRQMLPLDGEQIEQYRSRSDEKEKAVQPVPPTLRSRTVRVTLEPGQSPVSVRTTANIATSMVFHDSTGQPWPVTSVTNGGPQAFQVLRPELPEGNLLNVMPLQAYASANLVVTLAKFDIPLVISLKSDSVRATERTADSMVLFQLAHQGPNAQPPLTRDIKETVGSEMLSFLDHVPPAEAVRVRVSPQDRNLTVWKYNGVHYVRTTHTIIWPAWISVINGAGGIRCYELPLTPRITLSKSGKVQTVRIENVEN